MRSAHKPSTVRDLGRVEIADLKQKVAAIDASVWETQNASKPNKFGVFNKTEHIIFRFIDSFKDHRYFTDKALWADWHKVIEPIMTEAVKPYGYEKGAHPRIMLAKLPAHGEISKHIDRAPAAQFPHKIHVPLFTNPQCHFHVGGHSFHMETGKAYEVNNNDLHWVTNEGDTDRIHLIFEYFPLEQS